MSEVEKNIVNGVNIAGLKKTVGNMKKDPSLACCEFRVRNQWVNGDENRSEKVRRLKCQK